MPAKNTADNDLLGKHSQEVPGSDQLGNTSWRPILLLYQKAGLVVSLASDICKDGFRSVVLHTFQTHALSVKACQSRCLQPWTVRFRP